MIVGATELVTDRSLGLLLAEIKRQTSRGGPSPRSRHAGVRLCSCNLLVAPRARGRSQIAAIQGLMLWRCEQRSQGDEAGVGNPRKRHWQLQFSWRSPRAG